MHDRDSLLLQWARRISGDATLMLTLISGDASFRRYYRGGGLVWVDANPKTEKNHEFVRNAAALQARQLLAPEVKAVDYEQGLLAVTDLGDTQLISCLNEQNVLAWYGKAVDLLPRLGAVELVLECGARSAEHDENMHTRLKAPPMPEAINSPLQISEEPIADTARYDRLRDEVTDHA